MCGGAQGSQIFKRNSIILIRSKVIAFLVISLSPHGPCGPHIVPVIPTSSSSSPCHPHSPQKVSIWSPWLWSLWSPPNVVSIVPMVPTSPPSSPCCPCHPHIIPTSFRRSPHHLQPPDTHSTHPNPPGGGGLRISKNAIRFELIKIF